MGGLARSEKRVLRTQSRERQVEGNRRAILACRAAPSDGEVWYPAVSSMQLAIVAAIEDPVVQSFSIQMSVCLKPTVLVVARLSEVRLAWRRAVSE